MAIKFFLVYLGSLLVCSIALFTTVKQFSGNFAAGGKKPAIYGSFSSIIASLAAYAATFVTKNLFTVFWVFVGIFISFGIIHMAMVHKKYFTSDKSIDARAFLGELLFAIAVVLFTILLFSSLQYFLTDDGKNFLFYPMMLSALGFFIPVLVIHTFDAAFDIPSPVYPTWIYPAKALNLPEDDPREKLLVIGFEIAKKMTDARRTYFRAKAPENIYFGDLYYFFINDYNEVQSETPIQFCDKNEAACEWIFRLKRKWYQGRKIVDPALSVKDNGIKENSVIVCQRI